jgi:hypothetical protein
MNNFFKTDKTTMIDMVVLGDLKEGKEVCAIVVVFWLLK